MERPRQRACIVDVFPDHLLQLILEKLQDRTDRNNWSLVCKQFLRLRATFRRSALLLRTEVIPSFLQRYTDLEHLNLSSCLRVNDDSLLLISQFAGSQLRSLNLSKAGTFTDVGLAVLTSGCVALTDLDLSFCNQVTDLGMVAIAQLANLQSLKLAMCEGITDAGLNCITTSCPRLLHLSLSWCSGISDLGVIAVGSNCSDLRSLDLSYTEVTNIGLASVARLEHLEDLSLVACHSVDDEGLASLKNGCKSLQKLDVSRCQSLSYMGFMGLAQGSLPLRQLILSYCLPITDALLRSIQRFNGLQSVKFDGCDVGAADLSFVGVDRKVLKELSLSKCSGVTDFGLFAALAGCRGLRKLDLTCCRELSNIALISIAAFCEGLVSLKMESCFRISGVGISALGNACHFLEELDFTSTNLNDIGLISLAKCTALKVLKLGYCADISDKGLEHISSSCSQLLELDMYRSSGIGDAGVAAIASGCPKLRALNLSYCWNITNAALQKISELHELHCLEIRGCTSVSSVGLTKVAKGCRQLVELDVKWCSGVDDAAIIAVAESCPNLQQAYNKFALQINLSHCAVADGGLVAIAKLSYMQDMKLVHLKNVSLYGFGAALLACGSLKKVKLLPDLKIHLPAEIIEQVESRGCRFRWIQKLI